jgi:hypothetical protein
VTPLRATAEEREHAKTAMRAGAPVQAALMRRHQQPASAATQTTARAALAAPSGRSRACAHVGTQGAARAARTAPSSTGRR